MNPLGTIALSDALEIAADNPDGWQYWAIAKGPAPTLAGNVLAFCAAAADIAKGYDCRTLILWNGFGGSRTDADTGFVLNILDHAAGLTLADINACSAAIAARGVRPGIGISPVTVRQGVNGPMWDASNPVGTLLSEAALAKASGFQDFYVDSCSDECMAVDNKALAPDRFAQVVNAFPDSLFLVEFWDPGYAAFPNVIHWRKGADTFTQDRPQAVALKADDVKSKAMQMSWAKRLRDTGSTVLLNCRPDDPTLAKRQAGAVAAWKASQGK